MHPERYYLNGREQSTEGYLSDLHGTKVELTPVAGLQFQSDERIDRVNLDAPNGYDDAAPAQRFAWLVTPRSRCPTSL